MFLRRHRSQPWEEQDSGGREDHEHITNKSAEMSGLSQAKELGGVGVMGVAVLLVSWGQGGPIGHVPAISLLPASQTLHLPYQASHMPSLLLGLHS